MAFMVIYAGHGGIMVCGYALWAIPCHHGGISNLDGVLPCGHSVMLWVYCVWYEGDMAKEFVLPAGDPLGLEAGVPTLPHERGEFSV